jgi:hypothetical protein
MELILLMLIASALIVAARRYDIYCTGKRTQARERAEHLEKTKTCEFCLHWDHALGQVELNNGSTFARVTSVRSPADMAEQYEQDPENPSEFKRDEKGNRIPKPVSLAVKQSKWIDLGECTRDSTGVFRTYTCVNFNRDMDATDGRKKRFLPVHP